jgi:hypothetical protein
MTEPETTPRRGRRARALSPEELAALEARSAVEPGTGETAKVPGRRGAVPPPDADAPVPALRKFGRRARIIELSEQPAPAPVGAPAPRAADATVERDSDGVELGELPVSEAPDPRPAPRFDGKVLHRPESSGGRRLLWLVWVLVAIALVVLVVLLLTGMLSSAEASAAGLPALPDLLDPASAHPVLEDPAA